MRLLILLSLFLFVQLGYSKLVAYRWEPISGVGKFSTAFANAYQSENQPEIIYFQESSFRIFKFNQTSGDRKLLVGCYSGCMTENSVSTGDINSATTVYLTITSFHVDETSYDTIYIATNKQIYKFQNGNLILLSKQLGTSTTIQEGSALSNTIFTKIGSISRDPIGNLYICDESNLYRVDLNGIIKFMSLRDGFTLTKKDGFSNETMFSTYISNIRYHKGYLYGCDLFSIFKINLQTWWMTVIQGRKFDGNTNDGPALDAKLNFVYGFAVSPIDDSIYLSNLGYWKVINQTTGNISTILLFDSSIVSPTFFSPNHIFHAQAIMKADLSLKQVYPILNINGAIIDGTNVQNRVFDSIAAIAFNQSSNELLIADSNFGFNLKKVDLTTGTVSTIPLIDKFSNVSCWNSSEETNESFIRSKFIPNALQLRNSDLYVSSTKMIQKIDVSKGNGCLYAGSITGDRLRKKGPPSSIILKNPTGIFCLDSFSTIYIADTDNHRILKYTSNEMVEVIAGIGFQGFSGDGGLAINAQLNKPHSVHFDKNSGNIYIADSGNHRIRMIFPNGTITTIVGSGTNGFNGDGLNPLETHLNLPKYVFYDSEILYISDSFNHRVRSFFNGTISTVLGNGITGSSLVPNNPKETQLNSPFGLFVSNHNLFVADTYNHRILCVYYDFKVEIIAGTGESGYNGDGMVATQAKLFLPSMVYVIDQSIYIADTANNKIRIINGGVISSFHEKILSPIGLCSEVPYFVYTAGNLVLSNGRTEPLVGGIADGSNVFYANVNPTKILLTTDNKMVISESETNRIRMIDNIKGGIKTISGTVKKLGLTFRLGLGLGMAKT
ncbi:predicted protein [Naegleria gruberi]|uniref:Predicted protein n=1 Tax=Naegleria gruberi TaxID=5762 RepID=D2VH83_NAEGR|nr:uncharacterized protein NAEGRDRAFT_68122 [Naegleria gruberi]EFC43846.1 predicted protein [Naegleria gruberi]|eukprot:XP_002676590.1 predicted protein [Naegleria gruberi strain NEG-M]